MGFDLYGVLPGKEKPTFDFKDKESTDAYFKWQQDTKGSYFRNNVWWWRPLWKYVCTTCGDILSDRDMERGSYNDGHLIVSSKASKLSDRLQSLIDSGEVKKYADAYKKHLESLPKKKCWLCKGTGKRNDMEVKDGCNSCSGTGFTDDEDKSYPFNEENVQEFAWFCAASGGFEIS